MKRLLLAILLPLLLMSPALAVDPIRDQMAALDIDSVEDAVPQDARTLLGDLSVDVGTDYNGAFTRMLRNAWPRLVPWIREGFSLVLRTVAVLLLCGIARSVLPDGKGPVLTAAGTAALAVVLFSDAHSLFTLARETIEEISLFSRLLLPVLVSAGAASGAVVSAGSRYAAAAFVSGSVIRLLDGFAVPAIYCHMALAAVQSLSGDETTGRLAAAIKNATGSVLKTVLTLTMAYFSLTGILSGTADAMTLKTARLALSTGIPVLGGILSDAAGAVLTAARLIRNALGAFGILAVTAAALLPLARIGVRYLLFRFAAALSALSGDPALIRFVDSAADAMGLLLGLCGTCMLLLVLTILACMTLGGFV